MIKALRYHVGRQGHAHQKRACSALNDMVYFRMLVLRSPNASFSFLQKSINLLCLAFMRFAFLLCLRYTPQFDPPYQPNAPLFMRELIVHISLLRLDRH